jgi:cytochrome c-type biogenesis protein CcmE
MELSPRSGPVVTDLQRSTVSAGADKAGPDWHGSPPPSVDLAVDLGVNLAAPRRRRSLGNRRQKIVAAIIILGALGFLVARGLANAMNYYLTANQAVAQRAQLGSSDFRVQGKVLPGIHQVGTTLHFVITAKNVNVDVVSTGSPPQLFHVGMPVVLDGHWQGNVFSSFQIMIQHGSTYVEAHPGKANSGTHGS